MTDPNLTDPGLSRRLVDRATDVNEDSDLLAIDALFLLACRRSEAYLPILRQHDWSSLPQALGFGLADAADRSCDQLHEAAKDFFTAATTALLEGGGSNGTDPQVLRAMQLRIGGVPAQQLAERLAADPLQQRNPKTYRNWIKAYGYPCIRDWARTAVAIEGEDLARSNASQENGPSTDADASLDSAPAPGTPPHKLLLWGLGAMAVLATVLLVSFLPNSRSDSRPNQGASVSAGTSVRIPVSALGLHVEMGEDSAYRPRLRELLPDFELPNLGTPIFSLSVIAQPDIRASKASSVPLDSLKLLLGTDIGGSNPGMVTLWDPVSRSAAWNYHFEVRPGEAEMDDGLPDDVAEEAYRVRWLTHSSPYGSLGEDRAVAIFQQKSAAYFVVFLDLRTGEEFSRYASYGDVSEPLVVDVDGDGRSELLLAGCDNSCDAPTLSVLDPQMPDGASASVKWNVDGEAAKWKVIFPDPRLFLKEGKEAGQFPTWKHTYHPRLHTQELTVQSWDARHERLTISIGVSSMDRAYFVALPGGRPSLGTGTIRLGDRAEHLWSSMGLDVQDGPAELASYIRVIEQGESLDCPIR